MCAQIVGGDGLAGFLKNLQRTDDPLAVGRMQLQSSVRVNGAELFQHGFHANLISQLLQSLPCAGGRVGGKVIAFDQGVHIQPRAAGDDGNLASCENVIDNGRCHGAVAADGEIFIRLCYVQHVVHDALTFFQSRFGGADVHTPVNLHGVAGYHFTVQFLCKLYGQRSLAGGSGSCNANNTIHRQFLSCA